MFQYIWAADAGDLVTSAFLSTIPHPPGFPLYWFLLKLAYVLPFGTIAFRATLVSMFFSAASMFVSILTVFLFLKFIKKTQFIYTLIGVTSVVYIYSSFVYMLYSSVQEVYTFSFFLLTITSYFLLKYILYKSDNDHLLFWLFFIIGSVHHAILSLLGGIYVIFYIAKKGEYFKLLKKQRVWILFFFVLALVPYLFQYIFSHEFKGIYWEPHNAIGFVSSALRLRYETLNTGGGFGGYAYKLANMRVYFAHIITNYSIFIVIIFAGLFHLYKNYKQIFKFFASGLFFYGIFLTFYMNSGSAIVDNYAVIERYYLFSYFFLPIPFLVSVFVITESITAQKIITSKRLQRLVSIILIFFIFFLLPFLTFYKSAKNLTYVLNDPIVEEHGYNILNSLPNRSVLILASDVDIFPVQYLHFVKHVRKDVIVLASSDIYNVEYHEMIRKYYPQLAYTPDSGSSLEMLEHFFAAAKKSGYSIYTNFLFPAQRYSYRRVGYLYEVYTTDTQAVTVSKVPIKKLQEYTEFSDSLFYSYQYPVYYFSTLRNKYSAYLLEIADKYYSSGDYNGANAVISNAYHFEPQNPEIVFLYTLTLQKTKQCNASIPILLHYFNDSKSYKAAYALARVYAVCKRDLVRFTYWDEVYKKLKP